MASNQDSARPGKIVVYGLLAWAVVGALVLFSNQDPNSMSVSAKVAIAWPIFVFIAPPGWALLVWIWNFGSKQPAKDSQGTLSGPAVAAPYEGTNTPTTSLMLQQPATPVTMPTTASTPTNQSQLTIGSGLGAKPLSTLHTSQGSSVGPQNRSRPGATFDSLMDEATRRKIATYHQWICQLCLERIPDIGWDYENPNPRRLSIDHIVPKSRGGSDELSNLQPVHASCNSIKGAQVISNEEFRRRKAIREAPSPSSQSWGTAPSQEDKEPRLGDWRPADKVVSQLERDISRAKLSPEQRIRALEFLSRDHSYELLKNCQRGHPFTLENTYFRIVDNGLIGRECRVCRRESKKNQS
jgi:hypothetical protein